MSQSDFENLVKDIVSRVMEQIRNDDTLSQYFQHNVKSSDENNAKISTLIDSEHASDKSEYLFEKKLVIERDITQLARKGVKKVKVYQNTIITPAAQDIAREKNIAIIKI